MPHGRTLVTARLDDEALQTLRRYGEVEYSSYGDEMRVLAGSRLSKLWKASTS